MSVRRTDSPAALERRGVAAGAAPDLEHPAAPGHHPGEPSDRGGDGRRQLAGALQVVGGGRVVRPDGRRARGSADVMEVMDDVVQLVARERLDRERVPVAPAPGPLPGQRRDRVVEVADRVRRGHERRSDDRRQLIGVPTLLGRAVLVPVVEERVVLGEHLRDPVVVDLMDVVDVAGVLQRRPPVGTAPLPRRGVRQEGEPHVRVLAEGPRDRRPVVRRRVEATLVAGPVQHPGPVLRVGLERRLLTGHRHIITQVDLLI